MQTSGTRVLIVDDEPASQRLLEVRLRPLECDVAIAVNGEEALSAIRKDQPDLILLDLQMPKMGGIEVLRALRASLVWHAAHDTTAPNRVLNACRSWLYAAEGRWASKDAAAAWAAGRVDRHEAEVIDHALALRAGSRRDTLPAEGVEELAERVRMMSLHGMSRTAWTRYADRGDWYYQVLDFGFKYNLTDIAAAIGVHQLKRAEAFWRRRGQIAARYSEAFAALEGCRVPVQVTPGTHAWHLYILQIDPDEVPGGRDAVITGLQQRRVKSSVHFIPLHQHPAYQATLGVRSGACPVAERVYERALSLPIYPAMTDAEVGTVIGAVTETITALRRPRLVAAR